MLVLPAQGEGRLRRSIYYRNSIAGQLTHYLDNSRKESRYADCLARGEELDVPASSGLNQEHVGVGRDLLSRDKVGLADGIVQRTDAEGGNFYVADVALAAGLLVNLL